MGFIQARILEWVAISVSIIYICAVLCLVTQLCLTLCDLWTVAQQTLLSIKFSRQEYWNGLLFPTPEDLPDPGIEPRSPASQANSLPTELQGKPPFPPLYFIEREERSWYLIDCRHEQTSVLFSIC